MKTLRNPTIIGILLAAASATRATPIQALANDQKQIERKFEKNTGGRRLLNWLCVGNSLGWGQELRFKDDYNEFICLDKDPNTWNRGGYRFGIYEGRVVILNAHDEEVWGSDKKKKGTHIRLQRGGKLVLLDDDNKMVWATKHGCQAPEGRLEIRKTGFFMVDSNKAVKWYVDFDGNESRCDPDPDTFPADPCKEVQYGEFSVGPSCRMMAMNMDSYNYEQALMEVKKVGEGKFRVKDVKKFCWFCESNWASLKPTKMILSFAPSGALVVNGKTTWQSCRTIVDGDELSGYYWEFHDVRGYDYCNDFGKNLIKTMTDRYEEDDVWGCISDC